MLSENLPHLGSVADDIAIIRTMQTEEINHAPAQMFLHTGFGRGGRPSFGSWVTYGLGAENDDLPAYVVLLSGPLGGAGTSLWASGFLPSRHQGIQFRSTGEPVLFLNNPKGHTAADRRRVIDAINKLNQVQLDDIGDPEVATRISQYEMAFRMQTSVPKLTDLSNETAATFEMYGEDSRKPGSFAWNCLMARRLCERGVRFVQLFHRGWDQHLELPKNIAMQCRMTDQPAAALVVDLEQRGLLDDTVVTWGGEFGRTVYCQGKLTPADYGRDHHPRCFSMWLAGGGVQPGLTWGETDDFSYNIVRDPVHVHDLNATLLHLLGIDHVRLT